MAGNEENGIDASQWQRSLCDNFFSMIAFCRMLCDDGGSPNDLVFIEVNKNFAVLTGLEDPIGRRWTEIFPIHSKEEQDLFELFDRVISSKTPEKCEIFNSIRNGWYSISVYPIEREYLAIVFDVITEQKIARQALKESEDRYRRMFNSMVTEFSLLEAVYDENGKVVDLRFLEVNPAFEKLTGSKAENYIGKTLLELPGPNNDFYIEFLARVVTSGEPQKFESYVQELDKYLEHTAYSPKPGQVAVLSLDVTGRKRAEAEKIKLESRLQQSYKMEAIGSLAGGIAHDFNNILSAIIGYSELARFKVEGDEPLENELQEIYNAGIRARDLVKQILTFSRQADITREPLDAIPLFKEALKFLRASLPVTIQINQDFPAHPCMVMADASQMHQMLMNLCTNAAHAMKENGGVLEVSAKPVQMEKDDTNMPEYKQLKPGRYLRINVSDTGCGIAEELVHRIFDPFFTTKQRGEGTGMGLSVVHGIVNDMGGGISAYSFPGKGSSFHVFLPLLEHKGMPSEAMTPVLQTGSGTILLVDDEEAIIDSGRGILEHLGYTVVSTTRPIEALEMFKANPDRFDLVVTDQTMPGMTGLELAEQLHKVSPDKPVVLCTGYGMDLTPQKLTLSGICSMILKPVSTSELAETVHEALGRNEL